jgi:hypothetical protein
VKRGVSSKKQKPGKNGDGGGISDDRGERLSKAVVTREGRTSARREEVTHMVIRA